MSSLQIALISLHTSPFAEPGRGDVGGMNVVVKHLALSLANEGHSVSVFTRRTDPAQPEYEAITQNLRLYYVTAGPAALLAKADQVPWIDTFGEELARYGSWDIIHSHHWLSGLAALPLAQRQGIPHLQSFHSIAAAPGAPLSDGEPPESKQRQAAEAYLAKESTAVVAISQAEAQTIRTRLGANNQQIRIIAPGVDVATFRPRHTREAPPREVAHLPSYILAAARLEPLKGMELAISALAQIPPGLRPHLVIAGEATAGMEAYVSELKQLPQALGVSDQVHMIGSLGRSDFAHLVRHAKLMVIPSYSETYGLVALEAAASGVPTVAFAAGGLVEAVCDGDTGVVLRNRDARSWGQTMAELLADSEVLAQMSVAGRRHALGLTWERAAQELIDTYCEVITHSQHPAARNCLASSY